jgi:LysR family transcriptional regulator, nod-box dependent transcriptional activator
MPDLRKVDLNLLVDLDALLDTRNVSDAARRLNRSQSTVSGSLARLRKVFDDPLLVRNGRALARTARADALAGPVREILGNVTDVLASPEAFDPATAHRTFSISASDYAAAVLLAPMQRTLSAEAPNVTINVRLRTSDVRGLLREDQVDIAIEPREAIAENNLPHEMLFRDRWVCMADASVGRIAGGAFDVDLFLALPHILYSVGPDMQQTIADRHLADLGLRRRVEVTVESFLLVPMLVRGTDLVSLVLERSTRLHSMEGLALLEPPVPVPGITEMIYWNPKYTEDRGHAWLRGKLLSAAAGLVGVKATSGANA